MGKGGEVMVWGEGGSFRCSRYLRHWIGSMLCAALDLFIELADSQITASYILATAPEFLLPGEPDQS